MTRTQSQRNAFTLIELLVVIAIIGLLISILLPALSAARESGKESVCKANMREFGSGFLMYSGNNDEYLCSGAFDPEFNNGRDGPVDQVGWVADLVNNELASPGKALCPSNFAIYNQKLGVNGNTYTPEQAGDLIFRGYNTNYTQSWYMARTEWRPGGGSNMRSLHNTYGALSLSSLKNTQSSTVPLLCDGRTDMDDRVLGQRTVKTMTDGPYGGPYGTQNYADFGPSHGMSTYIPFKEHNRVRANMLFADGHVSAYTDRDHDGEFALRTTTTPHSQKDLTQDVFDGVLSIGRRSASRFQLQ